MTPTQGMEIPDELVTEEYRDYPFKKGVFIVFVMAEDDEIMDRKIAQLKKAAELVQLTSPSEPTFGS